MKKILFFAFAFLMLSAKTFAQTTETITVKGGEIPAFIAAQGYKYPTFMRARVYFNNGDSAGGKLNYNYLLETMQFLGPKNDTLVITDQKNINYISIGIDTFFYDNGYYEWVASSATARLAVKHSLKTVGAQKLGAFGIPSATNKIESEDMVSEIHPEKLDISEQIVFIKKTSYYVSGMKSHFIDANKRNITRLFPNKKIEDYVSDNKLNLNKEQDLVDLFVYVNRQK